MLLSPHSIFACTVRIRMRVDNTDLKRNKNNKRTHIKWNIFAVLCCFFFLYWAVLCDDVFFFIHSLQFFFRLLVFCVDSIRILFTYDVNLNMACLVGRLIERNIGASRCDIHHYGVIVTMRTTETTNETANSLYVLTMESNARYFDDNHHTRSVHWTYEQKTRSVLLQFK